MASAYRWPLLIAAGFTLLASTVPFAFGGHFSRPRLTTYAGVVQKYSYKPLGAYPLAGGCGNRSALGVSANPVGKPAPEDPAVLAQRGLDCHALWTVDGKRGNLRAAVGFADRLVRLQDRSGAWYYTSKKPLGPGVTPNAPWASATAQGLALSLLSRVYRATGRERYLEAARSGLRPFEHTFDRGGVRTRFLHGGTWYDGYAHDPPVYVLSSFLTGLVGLSDLSAADPDSGARRLFLDGMRTLPRSLAYFDTGQSQLYWLYHLTQKQPVWAADPVSCGSRWAKTDTWLVGALESVHPDPWLRFYRDMWARYLDQTACAQAAPFSLTAGAQVRQARQRLPHTTYNPRGPYILGSACPKEALTDPKWVPSAQYLGHTYYNAGEVAITGLSCYSSWVAAKDSASRQAYLRMADWLIQHQDAQSGAWHFPFSYDGVFSLKAGYPSSYFQGPAMSLLTRAYTATGDVRYRRAALLALRPLQRSIVAGGLLTPFLGRGAWFEGYPHRPPPYTLDNFMFALIGLSDVSKAVPRSLARGLFREGYATLSRALPYFDAGNTSLFWLYHLTQPAPITGAWRNDCTSYEHSALVSELTALDAIRANPWIAFYRDLWANELKHPKCL